MISVKQTVRSLSASAAVIAVAKLAVDPPAMTTSQATTSVPVAAFAEATSDADSKAHAQADTSVPRVKRMMFVYFLSQQLAVSSCALSGTRIFVL